MRPTVYNITKKDIINLSCFFCFDLDGLLASAFSNLPLALKRHCIQVGTVTSMMVQYAPAGAVPAGLTRSEYANAVRYGGFYHDIGAYLVYNQRRLYPDAGERFLREQISERGLSTTARKVLLETVHHCGERHNGSGFPSRMAGEQIPLHAALCAIANEVDEIASQRPKLFSDPLGDAKKFVAENAGTRFSPAAAECFMKAAPQISAMYKSWRKIPPLWNNRDLRPLSKPIEKVIG